MDVLLIWPLTDRFSGNNRGHMSDPSRYLTGFRALDIIRRTAAGNELLLRISGRDWVVANRSGKSNSRRTACTDFTVQPAQSPTAHQVKRETLVSNLKAQLQRSSETPAISHLGEPLQENYQIKTSATRHKLERWDVKRVKACPFMVGLPH
ncbi:hypothetical protein BJ508DRAFT_315981 [Ascobolus immersus RN42]|uniref:Uncharacterized protein n=1 Tax=Ascobolus immersus RN42 TaxID=1160509 RepID=A0A3N4H8C3_ASCIM|nr:hypothetical protein BJ508DRAFT_315981 [Ascobolus immersus RN42]